MLDRLCIFMFVFLFVCLFVCFFPTCGTYESLFLQWNIKGKG